MCNDLIGAQLHVGQLGKCRLQCADELGFQLAVQLIAGIILRNISADARVEQQRVGDAVGIHTGAADRHIHIQSDLGIHHTEGDGVGGAKFIVDQLFGIEIIHPLVLSGIAAKGKPFAHSFKGLHDRFAQISVKYAGFGRHIVGILSRFGTDFYNLSLLHDHHALAVCHCNDAAVGDQVVTALCIGRAGAGALAAFDHHDVLVH